MKAIIIKAERDCYSQVEAAEKSMTVRELIDFLEQLDEDAKVVLSHDNGYTYGWLDERRIDDEPIEFEEGDFRY